MTSPREQNRRIDSLLSKRVAAYAALHRLWQRGERILVAVSGGGDSVALLHLLHQLGPARDLKLTLIHLDHGLRGQASREDARWVGELAERLNIPSIVEHRDLTTEIGKSGRSPEEAARDVRYTFFQEVSERSGITTLALGHQADDQAETVLMKLLRGCGPAGLGGMRPSRKEGRLRIIRPLLELWRRELRDYLTTIDEPYRNDLSNLDCRYLRNRIRHELLPLLEMGYNPKLKEILLHLSGMERERDNFIRDRLRRTLPGVFSKTGNRLELDCKRFSRLTGFEQGEILREVLTKAGVMDPNRRHFKALERIIAGQSGRRLIPGGGVTIVKEQDRLIIAIDPPFRSGPVLPLRELLLPGEIVVESIGARIIARQYPRPRSLSFHRPVDLKQYWKSYPRGGVLREYLDRDRIVEPLTVRGRHSGDRYRPLSMKGTRKIKDIFIDAKVPLSLRDLVPVIADGKKIIWLAGYRPAHHCRVREETETILEISLVPFIN